MNSEDLQLFTLTNKAGTILEILNLGAAIFSLKMKSYKGDLINVVVGPKHKEDYLSKEYLQKNMCFGASIGRYAGRISEGEFLIDGKVFKLYQENGVHLHGGFRGLQHKIWKVENLTKGSNPSINLSCFSEDGEEGYPGNLKVQVIYTLTEDNELIIEYQAETDKPTAVNLTNHVYFNLSGKGSVSDHELFIAAEAVLEVDKKLRPSGNYCSILNVNKDFSTSKKIGNNLLDDTFVFNSDQEKAKVRLTSAETGIELTVKTDQPAAVVYVPKNLPDSWEYQTELASQSPSICLELQNFPDAPNHGNFPNSILTPNEKYINKSTFQFKILKEKL